MLAAKQMPALRTFAAASERRALTPPLGQHSARRCIARAFGDGARSAPEKPHIKFLSGGVEAAGVVQFLGVTGLAATAAYNAHPFLLRSVAGNWDFTQEGDGSFETSFFGLVGIVYGFFAGNTFLILFDRQVNIVQELYGEVFALELLVQSQLLAVPDAGARRAMAKCVRRYIEEEVYNPTDMQSPFETNSAYSDVILRMCEEQKAGYPIRASVEAAEKLADAQSRRSALASEVLPGVHYVFLNAMIAIFVVCFLVFDAASGTQVANESVTTLFSSTPVPPIINEERRLAFSALVGVLVLTQQVLLDLSTPTEGLYSFRSCLDGRLKYLTYLLNEMETRPAGWVPDELQRLQRLGMIGGMTGSDEVPSVPDSQHMGGRKTGAALVESRGTALRLFESAATGAGGEGSSTPSHQ